MKKLKRTRIIFIFAGIAFLVNALVYAKFNSGSLAVTAYAISSILFFVSAYLQTREIRRAEKNQ